MITHLNDIFTTLIELFKYGFVQKALLAMVMFAITAGVLGPIIVARRMSFTVHACSELGLTGASAALLAHWSITLGAIGGCLVAAAAVGWLSFNKPDRDAVTAVIMSFGLGLAVLFLHLYHGRSYEALGLLTGQVVTINNQGIMAIIIICSLVTIITLLTYRQLIFFTVEPHLAQSRGLPTKSWSIFITMLIALVAAEAIQIVGSLLVMSIIIAPAASARYISYSTRSMVVMSTIIALITAVGGLIISLPWALPVSAPITMLAFLSYILCRVIHWWRRRH